MGPRIGGTFSPKWWSITPNSGPAQIIPDWCGMAAEPPIMEAPAPPRWCKGNEGEAVPLVSPPQSSRPRIPTLLPSEGVAVIRALLVANLLASSWALQMFFLYRILLLPNQFDTCDYGAHI